MFNALDRIGMLLSSETYNRGSLPLWLPVMEDSRQRPYGARSDAGVRVGELLYKHVPALTRGDLEIVAIARRQTVLTKVAVRRTPGTRLSKRPAWCSAWAPTTFTASETSSAANGST
ncbi:MAG TPA: hypothetical protein VFG86_19850 [Chloroflexota bacterium]|nr:hypothetical protein [Chloroflexota bacterium]